MKLAIVGSGVSGLVCAYLLRQHHEITLFEANSTVGGHVNTVGVEVDGEPLSVDTGFIVFNERTYPNFIGLLDELGVVSSPTSMSFSVRCDHCGLEYSGTTLNGLFAQRRNLLRPSFHRLLRDILRFNRLGATERDRACERETVREFLHRNDFSDEFARHYLLPMGAAIWSCPMSAFQEFPIRFILEFYRNHGLLSLRNRPTWRVVNGGSRTYIERMTALFQDRIRLETPVDCLRRTAAGVEIWSSGRVEQFDEVVVACHSDQALALLDHPTVEEREVLAEFPYSRNVAVLHTDITLLPRCRSTWASWNYHVRERHDQRPSVTYNMNILQHLKSRQTVCVTLNEEAAIAPEHVLGRFRYEHPIFTAGRESAQRRHSELIRHERISYCGAYWKNGFHEDGVTSALAVCRAFGVSPGWERIEPDRRSGNAEGGSVSIGSLPESGIGQTLSTEG